MALYKSIYLLTYLLEIFEMLDNYSGCGSTCVVQIIKDLVTLFPVIRDWIVEFLDDNKDMTASMVGRNMLIEQVRIYCIEYTVPLSWGSPQDNGTGPDLSRSLFYF